MRENKDSVFRHRLSDALEIRGMKQIELSEKTGISRSAINQYLSGYAMPKSDRIYMIAKALNVQEAWLMGFDVDMDREKPISSTLNSDMYIKLYDSFKNRKDISNDLLIEINTKSDEEEFFKRVYFYASMLATLSDSDRTLVENLIDTLSKKGEN